VANSIAPPATPTHAPHTLLRPSPSTAGSVSSWKRQLHTHRTVAQCATCGTVRARVSVCGMRGRKEWTTPTSVRIVHAACAEAAASPLAPKPPPPPPPARCPRSLVPPSVSERLTPPSEMYITFTSSWAARPAPVPGPAVPPGGASGGGSGVGTVSTWKWRAAFGRSSCCFLAEPAPAAGRPRTRSARRSTTRRCLRGMPAGGAGGTDAAIPAAAATGRRRHCCCRSARGSPAA
jgi:hypothetical protein